MTWLLFLPLLPLLAQDTGALIEGAATNAVSGEPVKKCVVNLLRAGGKAYVVLTDAEGRFRFANLEPGQYHLGGERPGFARQEFGARGFGKPGSTLTLDKDMQLKNLALKLTPLGAVSGKVTDDDGDPVVGASVQVLKPIYFFDGRRQLGQSGFAQTNDLGEYRIFGIPPGRYFLSAAYTRPMNSKADETFPPTYFPGVIDPAAAGRVEVAPGGQLRGIDIALRKTRSVRLRGKFSGPESESDLRNGSLQLYPRSIAGMSSLVRNFTVIRGVSGTFELPNVLPGSYMLVADQSEGKEKQFFARVPIEVGNNNADNLQILLTEGFEISGRLQIEGAAGDAPRNARVYLKSRDLQFGGSPSAAIKADGTFTLTTVPPGLYGVDLSFSQPFFYVKSIRFGETDAIANGLNATRSNRLEIVLSANGGQIDGQTASGARVGLYPKNGLQEYFKMAMADNGGQYSFRCVAPGDYLLLAFEDADASTLSDPEIVKKYEGSGELVSVKEGARETKQLKAIATPDSP